MAIDIFMITHITRLKRLYRFFPIRILIPVIPLYVSQKGIYYMADVSNL